MPMALRSRAVAMAVWSSTPSARKTGIRMMAAPTPAIEKIVVRANVTTAAIASITDSSSPHHGISTQGPLTFRSPVEKCQDRHSSDPPSGTGWSSGKCREAAPRLSHVFGRYPAEDQPIEHGLRPFWQARQSVMHPGTFASRSDPSTLAKQPEVPGNTWLSLLQRRDEFAHADFALDREERQHRTAGAITEEINVRVHSCEYSASVI